MEEFIHQQNLGRYRELLTRVTDEEQRKQIKRLLAEEEAKETPRKLASLPNRGDAAALGMAAP